MRIAFLTCLGRYTTQAGIELSLATMNLKIFALAAVLLLAPLTTFAAPDRALVNDIGANGDHTITVCIDYLEGTVTYEWICLDVSLATAYTARDYRQAIVDKIQDYATLQGWTLTNGIVSPTYGISDIVAIMGDELAPVAFSGDYEDLDNLPTMIKTKLVTGTVSGGSGVASIDISAHGFAHVEHVIWEPVDDTAVYTFGSLSSGTSTVSATVKKQTFTGVSVLGINVLGTVAQTNAPNSTAVRALVIGY